MTAGYRPRATQTLRMRRPSRSSRSTTCWFSRRSGIAASSSHTASGRARESRRPKTPTRPSAVKSAAPRRPTATQAMGTVVRSGAEASDQQSCPVEVVEIGDRKQEQDPRCQQGEGDQHQHDRKRPPAPRGRSALWAVACRREDARALRADASTVLHATLCPLERGGGGLGGTGAPAGIGSIGLPFATGTEPRAYRQMCPLQVGPAHDRSGRVEWRRSEQLDAAGVRHRRCLEARDVDGLGRVPRLARVTVERLADPRRLQGQ